MSDLETSKPSTRTASRVACELRGSIHIGSVDNPLVSALGVEVRCVEERLNVNGGAISVGHPFGMTGARLHGHALLEGRRRRNVRGRWPGCRGPL
jgi:acetyl-CoA acetyltransferase